MFLGSLPAIILNSTTPNFVFKMLKAFPLGDMYTTCAPHFVFSEDQEAEQSADLEVVIGKEEIVVGDEEIVVEDKEVAGQGK
jgi:hypothetical protein